MPLLGQELRRRELLRRKDAFDVKDQAKASQCKDTDMEESPIESTNANDWEDVVDTDDVPTNHIYISTLPPYKQQYSRHILSEGSRVPKKHNFREDALHQYNEWKKLIPSLVKPMLDYLSKTSGKPLDINITMLPCDK